MVNLLSASAANRLEAEFGTDTMIDVAHAISAHHRGERLITFREAIRAARRQMNENKAIKAVFFSVWCADDELWFIRVGCRGGIKKLIRLADKEWRPV